MPQALALVWRVRLSTCATRAKLADHHARELEIACAMASFLQLSKSDVPNCFGTLRTRRSVPKNRDGNKKPGVKRRASPSTVSWEGFARSSTVVYPVFVSNLTSLLRERLPARRVLRACPVFRHPRSIRVSLYSSSATAIFFCAAPVNFTANVEIRRRDS